MSSQPLNASYSYGGLPCTVLTIEELTGEEIQFAGAIRWTGVIDMSDAIGGVDVCVSGDISDAHTGLSLTAGNHTLQGVEALQFLRMRHGIGDGSDLGRISNQQQFMSSLVRKLKSDAVLSNPAVLFNFATTAVGLTRTDPPQLVLSSELANPTRMVQIAMAAKDVPYEDIVFVQYPTEYTSDFINVLPLREPADAAVRRAAREPAAEPDRRSEPGLGGGRHRRSRRADSGTDDGAVCHSRAVRLGGRRDARATCRRRSPAPPRRRSPAPAPSSSRFVRVRPCAVMIAGRIRAFARADAWRRRIVRPSAPPC